MQIKDIKATKILNSRKEETIEITINGLYKGSAPGGASIGKHEVRAFPKIGIPLNFVNVILNKKLNGMKLESFNDLKIVEDIIQEFDRTKNLSKIGGDVVIALEYALLQAMSYGKVWEFLNPKAKIMPMPLGNVVGGGVHFYGEKFKGEKPDIQEFLILPKIKKFNEAMFANNHVYALVSEKLKTNRKTDESALCPNLSNLEILDILRNILDKVDKELGFKVELGLDMAASQIFDGIGYKYKKFSKDVKEKLLTRESQIIFVDQLIKKYNLFYVEDPLNEEDFLGYFELKRESALICGDDLIATNLDRLKKAAKYISAVIIKPNQVGSLIKTKEVIDFAKSHNIKTVISHRSGETMDKTIAHLAVAWQVPFVKFGIHGKERLAKLYELKKIEREIS